MIAGKGLKSSTREASFSLTCYSLPFLAQITLDPEVYKDEDEGKSTKDAEGPIATAFRQLADRVIAKVSIQQLAAVTT